jgi:hypothetical protein
MSKMEGGEGKGKEWGKEKRSENDGRGIEARDGGVAAGTPAGDIAGD